MKKIVVWTFIAWVIFSGLLISLSPENSKEFGIWMTIVFTGILWLWTRNVLKKEENLRHQRVCYMKSLYENITLDYMDSTDEDNIIAECFEFLLDSGWAIRLEPEFNEAGSIWSWQVLVHDTGGDEFISSHLSSGLYGESEDYNNLEWKEAYLDAIIFGLERYYLDSKCVGPELSEKFEFKADSLYHLIKYVQNNLTKEVLKVTGSTELHTVSNTRCNFKSWVTELFNNLINISKEKYGK